MTYIKNIENEYGTGTSLFECDTCGQPYTLTPAIKPENRGDWQNCMDMSCPSYDPHRDAEILYMTDAEIAKEKKVISISMLRKRRRQ